MKVRPVGGDNDVKFTVVVHERRVFGRIVVGSRELQEATERVNLVLDGQLILI